ncbi:Heavy metal-associated domain, HMA [Dillenia turbinata]|uniref:Heavy metal-associated domain, HMA n=1 Tax=Dillenia turbinata TaxID=194707 RepID=A0AAN8W5Z8_9MAGN
MGEKEGGDKNEGEKKQEKKADDGKVTAVYKIDLHCEGCAKKVKRYVSKLDGVGDVKVDCSASKLTVTGNMDPEKLREKVAGKTNKKVDLVSPAPAKKEGGGGGGEKKPDDKGKADEKKAEEKKPKESTAVLKIRLHCEGCISKIRKIISKYNGVNSVTVDAQKDIVTIKGTMDVKDLVPFLKQKLKRSVEVVPPAGAAAGGGVKKDDKKDKEAGGGGDKKDDKKDKAAGGGGDKKDDKKDKEAGGGGGDKKDDKKEKEAQGSGSGGDGGGAKKDEAPKVEANKMEYYGYPYQPPPMFIYPHAPPQQMYAYQHEPPPPMMMYGGGYQDQGHLYGPSYPVDYSLHAPQMFSDENPNGCSVM